MKITTLLEDYPDLLNEWESFREGRAYSNGETKHPLFLKKLVIKRKDNNNSSLSFSNGINYIDNLDLYIIKFILTGKITKEYKENIKELLLEFVINKDSFSIHIILSRTLYGEIKDIENKEIAKATNLKELKLSLNKFFEQKLNLPYLKNTIYKEDKIYSHPITFATYFNCFLLDLLKEPYKIFVSKQSIFWRKRSLQIIIGLRGTALISFFTELLAENSYHKALLQKTKSSLEKKINETKEKRHWQKQLLELFAKERELITELQSLKYTDATKPFYTTDKNKEIDTKVEQAKQSLQSYKTKELIILQKIKSLGGDFYAKKQRAQHSDNRQYSFSIPPLDDKNKKMVDEIIGNYYLNLSQIEILEQDLMDLEEETNKELTSIKEKERLDNNEIKSELQSVTKQINSIIESALVVDKSVKKKNLLQRSLEEEQKLVSKIILSLKKKYKQQHQKTLLEFLKLLQEYLTPVIPSMQLVGIDKYYTFHIINKDNSKTFFNALSDKTKQELIIKLYITLLEFGDSNGGNHPLLLFIRANNSSSLKESLKALKHNMQIFLATTD